MHIFLQGPKRIGKSTVINKALDILAATASLSLGGFFTWNGGRDDPHIYMRPAQAGREGEVYRLASYDSDAGGLVGNVHIFELEGARLLGERFGADLIIMDELGFLESSAPLFRQAVLDTLSGKTPVLGVIRLGDIPWHVDIKRNTLVKVYDVNEENRDELPRVIARSIMGSVQG